MTDPHTADQRVRRWVVPGPPGQPRITVTVVEADEYDILFQRIAELEKDNETLRAATEDRVQFDVNGAVKRVDVPPVVPRESGWLVEALHAKPPQWASDITLYGTDWTTDANQALRFSRREDAEKLSAHVTHFEGRWIIAPTEHMFIGLAVETPVWTDEMEQDAEGMAAKIVPARVADEKSCAHPDGLANGYCHICTQQVKPYRAANETGAPR